MTEKTALDCPICGVCSTYVVEWFPQGGASFFDIFGNHQSTGNNPKYMSAPIKYVVHCVGCCVVRSDLFYDVKTDSIKVLDKR